MEDSIYVLGLDLGSISVNAILLDGTAKIVYEEPYTRHNGNPLNKARQIVERIAKKYPINYLVVTGSNGERLSEIWGLPYAEEVMAQAKGVHHLHPEVRTLIDIGGTDAKFVEISREGGVKDFGMNSSCASGTGSFLDQQAKRLELDIEGEFSSIALKSKSPARLAGRCAVFAKSDMIHLQQKATPNEDITMGLCEALARSYKSNIARAKELKGPISFQGGIAANQAMLAAFKKILKREDIMVPQHYFSLGALGAALSVMDKKETRAFDPECLMKEFPPPPEKESLPRLIRDEERSIPSEPEAYQQLREGELIEAYLGIDIGSVSTNVAVIDKEKRLLAKSYLPTAGKPIKAVQEGLREVNKKLLGKVRIRAVGVTGSGRYMIGSFVGADVIKNEITAQAKGALNIDPNVDTVFEIGGQDSKFISLERGVVVDFTMNKACAAGTGSFLEEQAEELKIKIKKEFEKIAFSSPSPADLGDRCTVFMESALFERLQRGVSIPDLVAGLAYSVAYNYLNKVVEHKKIGDNIFFQGGTACNRSVVAAFREILGKSTTVPPHNEVLGAIGVAIVAMEETREETKFKGFGLSEVEYRLKSFDCQDCSNHCKVNQVWVGEKARPLTYGDRCDKHSGKEGRRKRIQLPNLVKEREKLLLSGKRIEGSRKIGIPRALHTYELSPLWEAFFSELGYEVVISDATNNEIIHRGVEMMVAETCFPIKVSHGHVLNLLEKNVDYIFLPSIIDFEESDPNLKRTYNCPWSQALPYFVNSAIDRSAYSTQFLEPAISLRKGVEKALQDLGHHLGENTVKVRRAVKRAREAQSRFYHGLRAKGREILRNLDGKKAFVLISRPYNGCDPGLNLDIAEKMRQLGMLAIPMDFIEPDPSLISAEYSNMYWSYGQKILAATKRIKETNNLYPIYITNFACGPDSFVSKYFLEEMDRPTLELQIDEHSADAGIITRLEAFLDSIQGRKLFGGEKRQQTPQLASPSRERVIHIPYMDDHSYALKATFEAMGREAEVMEISNLESLREGQSHTTGRECYPCILTTGDMLKVIRKSNLPEKRLAFFMGTAQGPCRFGQYRSFHQQVLRKIGYADIPIISLDAENSYAGYGTRFSKLAWSSIASIDILRKIQRLIRPDEIDKGETNKVYEKYRDQVLEAVRSGEKLNPVMKEAAAAFGGIKRRNTDKPTVTVVGEIYVRHNPYSNRFIIDELEELGIKVELASMREWFMYTNETHRETSLRERSYGEFVKNRLKNLFQTLIEKGLESPFRSLVREFEEPEIEEILQLGENYLPRSIRGEAILTVGKTIHSIKRGRDGVANVMPFTCMPGNITWAIFTQIEKDYPDFPMLSLSYDGSYQANYLNKIRTFVSQVRGYHQSRKNSRLEASQARTVS